MSMVFGIFLRDLKALVRNPIALLVVGALLILPGLYAWYCIIANWDPYANTGQIPIAIVNEDKGATSKLTGDVDIGKQVTDKLRDNEDIDWRFYDTREEALEATSHRGCYATLVLPEDLSQNVVGIFSGAEDRPVIYYYPNEKYSAVAVKVADSAAQTLVLQVNQQFSSTVNQTLMGVVQTGVERVETNAGNARNSLQATVLAVQQDLDKVIVSLDETTSSIEGWRTSVAGTDQALASAAADMPVIREALSTGSADLDALRVKSIEFDSSFSKALAQTNLTLANLSLRTSSSVATASADVTRIRGSIDEAVAQIEILLEQDPSGIISSLLTNALESLKTAAARIDDAVSGADSTIQNANANIQDTVDRVNAASAEFSDTVLPQLSNGTHQLALSFAGMSSALGQFEPEIDRLRGVLSKTDGALAEAVSAIAQAKLLLNSVRDNLRSTVTDLSALNSALRVEQVAKLLDIEPENVGTFISSPVQMETEKIYPVSNYGTAVAPFYTNLALWIGSFILLSLIRLEVSNKGFEEATAIERYFGRWLLFVVLALLQSQVICGVDILLGIDCANPVAFMVSGAVCSFAYMNLLYALVITFRNIGKTLCILLLIMQVPGSSGMYPIEMMPEFFKIVHPVLPFTYGIDAMREALCGMEGLGYFADLAMLFVVVPMALVIGLFLRTFMMNLLVLFDEEMNKVGFFASEEDVQANKRQRFRGMMNVLISHDDYRDTFEQRAWSFSRRYKQLKRLGTVIIFAVPALFLVIMMPFSFLMDIDIDVKLRAFVFMVIVLLIVMFALMMLEYVNRSIEEQTRRIGASLIGDDFDLAALAGQTGNDSQASALSPGAHAATGDELPDATGAALSNEPHPASGEAVAMLPATPKHASRKERHGVAREIFKTDMRLGFQNVIGVVVIMLLVITPSLYAWFNIAGSWDPYSNTGNLKVAVANNDEGYKGDLIPITVNIGDTIVSQLRGNSSFNWEFVDEAQAVEGAKSGEYYASIVISKDFSRDMMTYLTDEAGYPTVTYYTNEKENPIAPIITQKGADSIQESIRESFTKNVDEVGLTIASDIVDYVSSPQVDGYIGKMSAHLDDALRDMSNGSAELRSLSNLAGTVSDVVASAEIAIQGIRSTAQTAKGALADAEQGVANAAASFDQSSQVVENALAGSDGRLAEIGANVDSALNRLQSSASVIPGVLNRAAELVNDAADILESTEGETNDSSDGTSSSAASPSSSSASVSSASASAADLKDTATKALVKALRSLADALTKSADNTGAFSTDITATRAEVSKLVDEAEASIGQAKTFYNDNVKTSVANLKATMGSVSDAAHNITGGLENAIGGLSDSTSGLTNQMDSLKEGLARAGERLQGSSDRIRAVKQRLADALNSGDVKAMQEVLLDASTDVMAERLAAPLEVVREPLFPVANFGSAMAPFYTVLSLWVGALVMISTMRVHVVEERMEELRQRFVKVRPGHEYLGRYGIFGFISLLQSLLVLFGDLLFLRIQCANPVLFVLLGVFVGQVFCLFVYTLTELFGDIGKALCVILLIMQVAASGGTFPVEMLGGILSDIAGYLPFYHGMSLLQECVAGIMPSAILPYIAYLLILVGVLVLVGVVVRRPFRILNDWLERQLEKTGYM